LKEYLTIVHEDLSESKVEEPESPYGFTYADYLTWNFKERIELIRGKIFRMSPAPSFDHQKIQANIFVSFYTFLDNKPCTTVTSPIDVRLKGKSFRRKKLRDDEIYTVVQPDIIVVCDPEKLKDNRSVDGAPDLVVEVLSPGSTKTETKHKMDLYEENGVLEFWMVYPEYKQVFVFLLNKDEVYNKPIIYEKGETITSTVLNGFELNTNKVFKL
jgi:Uma2 family endonuclease